MLVIPESERTVFPPSRLLFAPVAPAADMPASTAPPELVGIVGRMPNDAVAMIRLSDGETHSVRVGEDVMGWRVAAIAADRVRLVQGGRERIEVLPPTG